MTSKILVDLFYADDGLSSNGHFLVASVSAPVHASLSGNGGFIAISKNIEFSGKTKGLAYMRMHMRVTLTR